MSRAFVREQDDTVSPADIGERPVSEHRNLVTPSGLAAIEDSIAKLRAELAAAEGEGDREKIALAARDLRYWTSRRETAELATTDTADGVVRFGMKVTIEDEDGARKIWRIVGEDEADAAAGSISHVSPLARALFGSSVGETVKVAGKDWEIVGIDADD
jgi:transcription elongation GreA/GreB family factor